MNMKLKLAVIALITIFVCGLSITSISPAPSRVLADEAANTSGGGDAADAMDDAAKALAKKDSGGDAADDGTDSAAAN